MAMGMTYTEYWTAPCETHIAYREAHNIKIRQANELAWLHGLYNYSAVSSAIEALAIGLSGKNNKKPQGYVQEPIQVGRLSEKEKKELERKEREKAIKSFTNWKKAWDKRNGSNS